MMLTSPPLTQQIHTLIDLKHAKVFQVVNVFAVFLKEKHGTLPRPLAPRLG